MSRNLRIGLIAAAAPIILLLWVGVVFAMDRVSDGGEVLGNVTIQGVPLGGLTEAEARASIESVQERLAADPVTVVIDSTEFLLRPSEVGYSIDVDTLVQEAMAEGRSGGLFGQMRWWAGHLTGGSESILTASATYDRDALEAILRRWEPRAIDDPPSEGGILVQDDTVVPVYPEPGTGVDVPATADLIERQILGSSRSTVHALTEFRVPKLEHDDVDAVVEKARQLLGGPVTLAKIQPEVELIIPTEVLARSLASRVTGSDDDPEIELFFQIGPLLEYIDPIRDRIEPPPQNAEIVIRPDDVPLILPGQNGATIDDGALPDAVLAAAGSVTRSAPIPLRPGDPPEFTTDDAEALGITDLLYTATTFFSCCGDQKNLNRINNIHRIADEVHGAIVMPGEVFSLNEHVGQRTEEDGYKRAGAIIGPVVDCCDHPANIGGGVSQFTTTLYNAVFWSGLEDVDHTPHTLYFTRYPMVREATLGWPSPDLKFRNNTEYGIYIKTEYTDDSVTVKFFGDNGGMEVDGITSEPFNFTEPTEWFEPDLNVPPGQKEEEDDGKPGFTATVTRTITHPDGSKESQTWSWRYHPHPMIFRVHPCMLPDEHPDYDPEYGGECTSVVPPLVGKTQQQAVSLLTDAGLEFEIGLPLEVESEDLDGLVATQSHDPGEELEPGTVVVIRIGSYAGGDGEGAG